MPLLLLLLLLLQRAGSGCSGRQPHSNGTAPAGSVETQTERTTAGHADASCQLLKDIQQCKLTLCIESLLGVSISKRQLDKLA
jgi:hypothetical protein